MNAVNYLSSHQFIGVKRPELFEAGRKVCKELGYRVVGNYGTAVDDTPFDFTTMKPARLLIEAGYPFGRLYTAAVNHGDVATGIGCSWKRMVNPYISAEIALASAAIAEIQTSFPWTEENLEGLKEYFDTQGKYPELFEGISVDSTNVALANYKTGITNQNSRFFHIASQDGASPGDTNWRNTLGTDFYSYENYDTTEGSAAGLRPFRSEAIFFYRDETRKDTAQGGDDENNLYYGMFVKRTFINPYDHNNEFCIGITTRQV